MHKVWGVRGNKTSTVGVGRGPTTQGPPWGANRHASVTGEDFVPGWERGRQVCEVM